jgi:hypothetical protein
MLMTNLAWTILFTGVLMIADAARSELRWWQARRQAIRRPTLTGRYALPPRDGTHQLHR